MTATCVMEAGGTRGKGGGLIDALLGVYVFA
jgi:hypothetical protein